MRRNKQEEVIMHRHRVKQREIGRLWEIRRGKERAGERLEDTLRECKAKRDERS